jgi:hypothetical protein
MERVEVVGPNTLVLRTRQLGPNSWCCDVYRREIPAGEEIFILEGFGESEIEALAMAMYDADH